MEKTKKTKKIKKNGQIAIFAVLLIALMIGVYFGGHAIGLWAMVSPASTTQDNPPTYVYIPPQYEPFDPYPDPIIEDPVIPVIPDDPIVDPPGEDEEVYTPPPYEPFYPDEEEVILDEEGEEEVILDEEEPINFAYVAIAFVIVGAIILKVRMSKK